MLHCTRFCHRYSFTDRSRHLYAYAFLRVGKALSEGLWLVVITFSILDICQFKEVYSVTHPELERASIGMLTRVWRSSKLLSGRPCWCCSRSFHLRTLRIPELSSREASQFLTLRSLVQTAPQVHHSTSSWHSASIRRCTFESCFLSACRNKVMQTRPRVYNYCQVNSVQCTRR